MCKIPGFIIPENYIDERSFTYIYTDNYSQNRYYNRRTCNLYFRYAGRLAYYGAELADFLLEYRNEHPFVRPSDPSEYKDHMSILAVKLICHFSKEEYDSYGFDGLHCTSFNYDGPFWTYHVYQNKIQVIVDGIIRYDMSWEEFADLCKERKKEEEKNEEEKKEEEKNEEEKNEEEKKEEKNEEEKKRKKKKKKTKTK